MASCLSSIPVPSAGCYWLLHPIDRAHESYGFLTFSNSGHTDKHLNRSRHTIRFWTMEGGDSHPLLALLINDLPPNSCGTPVDHLQHPSVPQHSAGKWLTSSHFPMACWYFFYSTPNFNFFL